MPGMDNSLFRKTEQTLFDGLQDQAIAGKAASGCPRSAIEQGVPGEYDPVFGQVQTTAAGRVTQGYA